MSEANTPIERRSGIALWRQIAQILRNDIEKGELPSGARLPTEPELAQRFGVNRHTVRRAVGVLQNDGLVSVEQGRGTFVREWADSHPIANKGKFAAKQPVDAADSGETLALKHVAAEPRVAAALRLKPGEEVIQLDLVSVVNGKPVSLSSHFMPAKRFKGFEKAYQRTHSVEEALKKCGVKGLSHGRTHVSASLPSPAEAQVLRLPKGQPMVVAENVTVDLKGKPVEFTVSRSAGGRTQLVFEA